MTDEEKRARFLERLAKAGMSEASWEHVQRMRSPDLSGLGAREAHVRVKALQHALDQDAFAAIPRIKELLADDAPVVGHGARSTVFEVRMHALVVLQHLYRISNKELDFGPVQVAKAAPVGDLESRAVAALADLSDERRAEVLDAVALDLDARVCPPASDRALVSAYRVLQRLGRIAYETQAVDPTTYLTAMQEEIFTGQVPAVPARPCLRIGTATPPRTLGWVLRTETGGWGVHVSGHPLALQAKEEVEWLAQRAHATSPTESLAYLRDVAEFLRKRGYVADVLG